MIRIVGDVVARGSAEEAKTSQDCADGPHKSPPHIACHRRRYLPVIAVL